MTTPYHRGRYVALGSSFAAGPGIRPPAAGRPAKARQSQRNYPHLFAQQSGFDLVDVTSSAATVGTILCSPQFGQPAQIAAVTAHTDLVTVTVGGNDIGYLPTLIAASLPRWTPRLPILGTRIRRATAPAHAVDRIRRTAGSVGEVFTAIRHRAPAARIVCVTYLTVLPPAYREDLPFSESDYDRCAALAADLGAGLASAATDHTVDLVDAAAQSVDHHAWSERPWTSGWTRPPTTTVAYHPTADGMAAVADLLSERLDPTMTSGTPGD